MPSSGPSSECRQGDEEVDRGDAPPVPADELRALPQRVRYLFVEHHHLGQQRPADDQEEADQEARAGQAQEADDDRRAEQREEERHESVEHSPVRRSGVDLLALVQRGDRHGGRCLHDVEPDDREEEPEGKRERGDEPVRRPADSTSGSKVPRRKSRYWIPAMSTPSGRNRTPIPRKRRGRLVYRCQAVVISEPHGRRRASRNGAEMSQRVREPSQRSDRSDRTSDDQRGDGLSTSVVRTLDPRRDRAAEEVGRPVSDSPRPRRDRERRVAPAPRPPT